MCKSAQVKRFVHLIWACLIMWDMHAFLGSRLEKSIDFSFGVYFESEVRID